MISRAAEHAAKRAAGCRRSSPQRVGNRDRATLPAGRFAWGPPSGVPRRYGSARQRAPFWCSWAAPLGRVMTVFFVAFIAGFAVLTVADIPYWVPAAAGIVAGWLVDQHWRRTRPPSADAPWSPLARLLYRRDSR